MFILIGSYYNTSNTTITAKNHNQKSSSRKVANNQGKIRSNLSETFSDCDQVCGLASESVTSDQAEDPTRNSSAMLLLQSQQVSK